MNRDVTDVKALQNGGFVTILLGEEGGAVIHKIEDIFILFEIPQYGGKPMFSGAYGNAECVVTAAYTFT